MGYSCHCSFHRERTGSTGFGYTFERLIMLLVKPIFLVQHQHYRVEITFWEFNIPGVTTTVKTYYPLDSAIHLLCNRTVVSKSRDDPNFCIISVSFYR